MIMQNMLLKRIIQKMESQNDNRNVVELCEPLECTIKLPVNSDVELKELNRSLNTKPNRQDLLKKIALIGGNNIRLFTIRIIDFLMTRNCLNNLSWRGTVKKSSIMDDAKNVFDLIIMVVQNRYPHQKDIGTFVEVILKNKVRNANPKKTATKSTKSARQSAARCRSPPTRIAGAKQLE